MNYVVKIKSIKKAETGVRNFAAYLIDKSRKSHENTDIIILNNEPNKVKKFVIYNIIEEQELALKRQLNRKGGRPSTEYAKSLTFNFPVDFREKLTPDNISIINNLILKDIANFLDVDIDELNKKSLSVLHLQNNTHIHLLISTVLNKKKNRAIKSAAFLKMVKNSFTLHTNQTLKILSNKYKAKSKITYDKQDVIIAKNQMKKTIENLLKTAVDTKKPILIKALEDLESGKTIKAQRKIDKYLKNL